MHKLKIQEYLLTLGNDLSILERDYAIEHRIKNEKISLNYNQISSPMDQEICQECRGIILREVTFDVVAYPFKKFFNREQSSAVDIDIKNAIAYEKHDGSMVQLYWDDVLNLWFFATRSMPEADGQCPMGMTYANLAYEALIRMGIYPPHLFEKLNKKYTYIFELTCPHNTVVVSYKQYAMTLLAVRDLDSLKELPIEDIAKELNLPIPQKFNFNNYNDYNDLFAFLNSWNKEKVEHEGVVLVDKDFNRVKIKTACYIAAHGLISSLAASDRNIMRLILEDKADDLSFIKDNLITERVELFKNKLSDLLKLIHIQYLSHKDIQSDKDFALAIKDLPYKAVLFALRKNKYNSVVEYFRNKTCNSAIDNLIELCGVENG